mgnify:CR=1 FL=1
MQFGYFTLSDNRYPGNTRSAEDFLKDIYAEALFAEKVGLNSAWIGEHHFNLLGVNASPLAMLAQIAGATSKIRLAPAVTLLPTGRYDGEVLDAIDWALRPNPVGFLQKQDQSQNGKPCGRRGIARL